MGAVTAAVISIAALILGWITMEIACKPCLDKGREAIDRSLDPNYDPDDANNSIQAPLNPNPNLNPEGEKFYDVAGTPSAKVV